MRRQTQRFPIRGIAAGLLCMTLIVGCKRQADLVAGDASEDLGAAPAPPDASESRWDAAPGLTDAASLPRDASSPPADLTPRSCLEVLGGQTYLRSGVPWGNGREVKPPATWPGSRVLDVYSTTVRFVGDCMDGSMPGPVALDSSNQFKVDGSVFISRGPGGGIDMGGGLRAATYYGEVRGDTMTLRIKFCDGPPDHQVMLYCDDPSRLPMFC